MMNNLQKIFQNNKQFLAKLAILAIPIVMQEVLISSTNMADTVMVGRLGVNELAAVGLANQIFFLFILVIFGITGGSSIFMGQYWGKGDTDGIHRVMGICAASSFFVAVLFFAATQLCPALLMGFYSKDPVVIALGADYLRVIGYTYLILSLTVSITASLRSIGMTFIPAITLFVSLLVNVGLNYYFIFVLELGVKGAAMATIVARLVELTVLCGVVWLFKLPVYTKPKGYFTADFPFLKQFYAIALPVIFNEFFWALGTTIYNVAYAASGTNAQAAFQIATTTQNLFLVISIGLGSATGIMIANTLGANDPDRAIRYAKKSLLIVTAVSLVMGALLILISPYVLLLFKITDPDVARLAHYTLIVIGACTVFKMINFVNIVGILRGGGDTKFCLLLDSGTVWLIGIPMAFLGSYFLHLPIYITVLMVYSEEAIKFLISTKRVLSNCWAKSVIDT